MTRLTTLIAALAIAGAAFFLLTAPKNIDQSALDGLSPDLVAGEQIFLAGGCASCHSAPNATRETRRELGGGQAFTSDFGTFYAPNISPDRENGIGGWDALDLANAMRHGTSPDRRHYYPAFPYSAYANVELQDIVSLNGFLKTLPPVSSENRPHDIAFPFNIRALLGGWKLLFNNKDWLLQDITDPQLLRGRYLVEALGHCAECHTSRNILGGLDRDRWLGGAPNPTGTGTVPNITSPILDWSDDDILAYFTTGFTPDFDTVGGLMAEVVENLAQMPETDLRAIIAYLRAVPAVSQ